MNGIGRGIVVGAMVVGAAAWARYLSPEPLLQSPAYVRHMAQTGMSVPTYAYALNNPFYWIDPNGLDVTNNSPDPVLVKPENGPWFVLPPNRKWEGSPDAVDCHYSKNKLAVFGKQWMPKNDVVVDKSGTPRCTGGPCRVLPSKPWPNTVDHPEWAWDNSSLGPTPPLSFP